MNINTERQNLFSLSPEGQVFSPYLSPLFANNNSKDFTEEEELVEFQLDQVNGEPRTLQPAQDDKQEHLNLLLGPAEQVEVGVGEYTEGVPAPDKKPVYWTDKKDSTKIYSIINFLIENDELTESEIKSAGRPLYQGCDMLEYIFRVMITKFKKLKKTKEEMTKFCMRKAFKYAYDHQVLGRKKRKGSKQDADPENLDFEMPFRKNSTQKTMNAQFLKQVFSKPTFLHEYHKFLQQFPAIITRDNEYKIKYLSDTIEEYIAADSIKKVQGIKRLPWTRSILTKTEQLAFSLLKYGEQAEGKVDSERE